jgi:hypothetical protein
MEAVPGNPVPFPGPIGVGLGAAARTAIATARRSFFILLRL